MENEKPLILVTNDDGIEANGIRSLVEVCSEYGEVVVVAPDKAQSGQSNALTLNEPLYLKESKIYGQIEAYECSGKPVDCVKMARALILKDRKIDLCASGVNHGSNASVNVIYSGTMSAAMEASLEGIYSIGFSLLDYSANANFSAAQQVAHKIIANVLKDDISNPKLLNVNIPKLDYNQIKGMKICRQAKANWTEEYIEHQDPRGNKYYWMAGDFINFDEGDDHDLWALKNGYVSIVPSKHDLTAYDQIDGLRFLE